MRHEKVIKRENGTVVRLVANYVPNLNGPYTVDYFALVQAKDSEGWVLFTPHHTNDKSLRGLSVDEYTQRGRKGLLSVVEPHEILKAGMELDEKLREDPNAKASRPDNNESSLSL